MTRVILKHPRRGWKRRNPPAAPPRAPQTELGLLREAYIEALAAKNFSPTTTKSRAAEVARFVAWCHERSFARPTEITPPIIERYQRWLFYYRRPNGYPLSVPSQRRLLYAVRLFFRWLTRQHHTLFNPAADIELPRCGTRLPRDVLTAQEVEAVLAGPDVTTPLGIRDRAILETFYATGIRRSELAHLSVYDIDAARETLLVREGKFRKDRIVPIGERARTWIQKYVLDVRPQLVVEPDEHFLFLNVDGRPYRKVCLLNDLVNRYIEISQISKRGSCHMFRHTMATLMLENGADIRYIQEILGHANLGTTQVYTRVSIGKLQEIYRATHPAEKARAPDAADGKTRGGTSSALREILADEDDENDAREHDHGTDPASQEAG